MIKLRHLAAASAVVLTLAVAAPPASAQWIVYDPTNFSQNVLTAARELQQINNQITDADQPGDERWSTRRAISPTCRCRR